MGWLRQLFSRRRRYRELTESIREHLDEKIADLMDRGMTREQAEGAARREFGNVTSIEERSREVWQWPTIESLWNDGRFALRQLRKSPGFTLTAVLTLALGIGATTAIFSLVNAVMLQMLPVRNPQQLVVAQWSARNSPVHLSISSYGDCAQPGQGGIATDCSLSYPMYQELATQKDLFAGVMAFAGPDELYMSGDGPASLARGEYVSGSFFETLGVNAAMGRVLEPNDEKPGAAAVAVLDYAYWEHDFGGSPAAIGRTIHLNNIAFTIVGVANRGFTRLTPGKAVDLWVPLNQTTALGLTSPGELDSNNWWLTVTGRLLPGVSRVRAQSAVNALFVNGTLHGTKPVWKASDDPQLSLVPAQKALTGFRDDFGKPLLLLMAAVAVVLLIACTNMAGLMLARGASREKEMAVRLALGAGRRRVIRQLLTESLLLSFIGAALGALLADWGATGLAAFISQNQDSPPVMNLHPDARVLFFAIGVTIITGIGFGLAPALRGAHANVSAELKGSSSTTTQRGNGRRFGLGSGLVVVQVALSMVVLTGAGLLIRTLDKLHSINPGFDTRNVLLFTIEPQLAGYKAQRIQNLYENLQGRLSTLPGVSDVSYSSSALVDGSLWTADIRIDGQNDKGTVETQMLSVGPEYFATMRIPLLTGRILAAADIGSTQRAAVVNQSFVRRYLNGKNPIGARFSNEDSKDQKWEIVGVVGDTKYQNLRSAEAPMVFMPLTEGGATFALRTAVSAASLRTAVAHTVHSVDNNLPLMGVKTQTESIDRLMFKERLVTRLFGLFGALGLLLACIGLYGLLSYEVAQRTREIGIRAALGAQRRDVWLLVLRKGLVLVLYGTLAGIGVAMGVTRLLGSLLYDVQPTDAITFIAVAGLLILVGIVACILPARRAVSIDPMQALRIE